jgi:hypothetical protein
MIALIPLGLVLDLIALEPNPATITPHKTTSLKYGLLVRSYRPAQPKHTIAEGSLQVQPLTQSQTVA